MSHAAASEDISSFEADSTRALALHLARNLERSLEILEVLREMKAALYCRNHPEADEHHARVQVAWETVWRKERQWEQHPVSQKD